MNSNVLVSSLKLPNLKQNNSEKFSSSLSAMKSVTNQCESVKKEDLEDQEGLCICKKESVSRNAENE